MQPRSCNWLSSDRAAKCFFVLGIALCVIFKFWLIQSEEIFGQPAVYDTLWYLNAANHCYWDATYSWTAFLRPPGYPLFIALLRALGIPLRLGIEGFQIAGYAFLIYALRRAGLPRLGCLALFAAALFHPCSFQVNNRVFSDTFYAGALVIFVAALILALVAEGVIVSILVGISCAVVWVTRDETVLLLPLLATWMLLLFVRKSVDTNWLQAARACLSKVLPAFVTLTLLVSAVYLANYATFGSFANSEITSRSLRSAQRALTRIKPPRVLQHVLITKEALEMAYSASPTFAQLKPVFDGLIARAVAGDGLNGEIRGSWFRFALLIATNEAGFHRTPQDAREFYENAAREINQACTEHRIPCRDVYFDFFDPGTLQFLNEFPISFRRVCRDYTRGYAMLDLRDEPGLQAPQKELYDTMALRRPELMQSGWVHDSRAVENWIGRNYGKLGWLLSILAIAGSIVTIAGKRRAFLKDALTGSATTLFVAVAGRLALFIYFDQYTAGSDERFIFPVMALWSAFAIVMAYCGMQTARRLISASAISRAS